MPDIAPGVQYEGDDLGRWLVRQRDASTWVQLSSEQQKRLRELGVEPAERPAAATADGRAGKAVGKASTAFQRASRPSPSTSLERATTASQGATQSRSR
ncbi:helicase associated domain-containing protein [Streptomyces sp. NPDC003753]